MLFFSVRARVFVGVSLFGLLASVLISPATAAVEPLAAKAVLSQESSPAEDPVAEAGALAVRKAATTGADVVVDALTTPTELVTAHPGGTLTKVVSSEPVRLQRDGHWQEIDLRLVSGPEGIRPRTGPADVLIGAGGSDRMSSVGDNEGHVVVESWPYGRLPAPTIDNNTATYVAVLPGVDLVQVATKRGLSQVLKVYTAQALADPRVQELKIRLDVSGVDVKEDGAGGLKAEGLASRKVELKSSTGLWWDSRHPDAGPTDPGGPGLAESFDLDLIQENDQVHERPLLEAMPPSAELKFPVYIDPDWYTNGTREFVFVDSAFPATSYWNGQFTSGQVNVGFLPAKWDSAYGVNHTTRGYWQFNTAPSQNWSIRDARLSVTNIWSSSCTPRTVHAYVTYGITPGTTWNNQPGWLEHLDSRTFASGNEGAGCADSTQGFDMMAAAPRLATTPQWTVVLASFDETWDELSWKRFDSAATVTINYGKPPLAPKILGMTGCGTGCPGSGALLGTTRISGPVFTVEATDPDGSAGGSVSSWMSVARKGVSQASWWMAAGQTTWIDPNAGTASWGYGATGTGTGTSLPDGDYVFTIVLVDQQGMVSPSTSYDFRVDTSAPPAPTIATTSAALGAGMSDANGVVGQSVYGFTLTNPSTDPVKGFIYALTGEGTTPAYPADMSCGQRIKEYTMVCPADGKTASFTAAAITRTNTRITAWAVDEAGNVGTFKKTLNGSTAAFSVGNYAPMPAQGLPVTTVGSATALQIPAGTDGPTGSCTDVADESVPAEFRGAALGLQGGYAATAASAANTANSFTVSGWFCPTAMPGAAPQPVIAQTDSANTVLAELRINTASRWELVTRTSTGATEAVAVGTGNLVAAGSWYFVNAVYDKINRQLRITAANINDVRTWTVATTSDAHAAVPAGSNVLLGASSTTAGTPRFTGFLAGPVLAAGVLVNNQLRQLWATANPTTVTVLK